MTTENTNVAVIENNTTAIQVAAQQAADDGIGMNDLVISKILLMQNTSELVGDDKAKVGDMVDSQSSEVIGGYDKGVEIIPLKLTKVWREYDTSGTSPKYLTQYPVTADNENLPWEFASKDGVPCRRDMCMNFFVLKVTDCDEGMALPVVVSFRRTSFVAGKTLATEMYKSRMLGGIPYARSIMLKSKKQKTEKNTFAVYEIGKGQVCKPEHKQLAQMWTAELSKGTHKVDDSDDQVHTEEAAVNTKPSPAPVKPVIITDDAKLDF